MLATLPQWVSDATAEIVSGLVLLAVGGVWAYLRYKGVKVLNILKALGKMPELTSEMRWVGSQLRNNGGSSLVDKVDRIGSRLTLSEERFKNYQDADGAMTFYADGNGRIVWASTAMEDAIGSKEHDLLGFGWFGKIVSEERGNVRREWDSCFKDERKFDVAIEFHPDPEEPETTIWLQVTANPIAPGNYNGFARKPVI